MNENTARPSQPVLVCLDGGDDGDRAHRYAIAEAQRRKTGLRLLHVMPRPSLAVGPTGMFEVPNPRDLGDRIIKDALQRTDELAPDLFVEGAMRVGHRAPTIAEESYGVACVVVGTRSFTPLRTVAGSTSTGTAARAACPVIAVPPAWDPGHVRGQVVVGVDDQAGPAHVLETAFEEAERRDAALAVVHAWEAPVAWTYEGSWIDPVEWVAGATARLADEVAPTAARHPDVELDYVVRFENPRITLDAVAAESDLLVLGRHHGVVPLVHSLGSLPRHAIHQGTCPVLVVPPSGED